MKLHYTYKKPKELSLIEIERLYTLMEETYDHCNKEIFLSDLLEKDDVILLLNSENVIQGFTTLLADRGEIDSKEFRTLFSGDTVINQEYWGTPTLAVATVKYFCEFWNMDTETPLYWILISKGYRTYRFMPLYFHNYWPRENDAIPTFEKAVRDSYITKKYGVQFDTHTSIISADNTQYYLNSSQQILHGNKRKDVAFFQEANPGYIKGDELVCIAEISPENFRSIIKRFRLGIPNFS